MVKNTPHWSWLLAVPSVYRKDTVEIPYIVPLVAKVDIQKFLDHEWDLLYPSSFGSPSNDSTGLALESKNEDDF